MLLEANAQMAHGDFTPWAKRTFNRSMDSLKWSR
jgi:hypothetical protein